MGTWIGYARRHKEFEVEEALHALGINAWCPREIHWRALGKKRRPKAYAVPVLPNYVFIDMSAEQFYTAQKVKHLADTMQLMTDKQVARYLAPFREAVTAAYEAERKREAQGNAPSCEFRPAQRVVVRSPMLDGQIATFKRIVERSFDMHPKLELEFEMMNRRVTTLVDPLDVKAIGG